MSDWTNIMNNGFSVQKTLGEKFASFWPDFQQFNIRRTKRINEVMGHPLDGQIIQIVCWYQFLASVHEQEKQFSTYDECFDAWHHALEPEHIDVEVEKKLTISSIAMTTGMPFETVRRRVQNLKEYGWLSVDKKKGVIYSNTPENNAKIVGDIMEEERKLVVTMINRFLK